MPVPLQPETGPMPGTSAPNLLAGRYRLESRIASGGFGEVWRGTDAVLARSVAVKLLRAEFAEAFLRGQPRKATIATTLFRDKIEQFKS